MTEKKNEWDGINPLGLKISKEDQTRIKEYIESSANGRNRAGALVSEADFRIGALAVLSFILGDMNNSLSPFLFTIMGGGTALESPLSTRVIFGEKYKKMIEGLEQLRTYVKSDFNEREYYDDGDLDYMIQRAEEAIFEYHNPGEIYEEALEKF